MDLDSIGISLSLNSEEKCGKSSLCCAGEDDGGWAEVKERAVFIRGGRQPHLIREDLAQWSLLAISKICFKGMQQISNMYPTAASLA